MKKIIVTGLALLAARTAIAAENQKPSYGPPPGTYIEDCQSESLMGTLPFDELAQKSPEFRSSRSKISYELDGDALVRHFEMISETNPDGSPQANLPKPTTSRITYQKLENGLIRETEDFSDPNSPAGHYTNVSDNELQPDGGLKYIRGWQNGKPIPKKPVVTDHLVRPDGTGNSLTFNTKRFEETWDLGGGKQMIVRTIIEKMYCQTTRSN